MYKNVLFDLDGTLTDPGEGITASVAYALNKLGITPPPREELYKFIGPPLGESFMKYYSLSEDEARVAIEYYREYFKPRGMLENKVYPDIPKLLKALRAQGLRLIVATSKPEVFAVTILEHFGLAEHFDLIAGSDLSGTRILKADVIRDALCRCGITALDECIMIGDRLHDVEGAAEVGIDSVGVLWGYGSHRELTEAGAVYIAESVFDIMKILSHHGKSKRS